MYFAFTLHELGEDKLIDLITPYWPTRKRRYLKHKQVRNSILNPWS